MRGVSGSSPDLSTFFASNQLQLESNLILVNINSSEIESINNKLLFSLPYHSSRIQPVHISSERALLQRSDYLHRHHRVDIC